VTSLLEKSLRSDQALASVEETLIRRARELQRLGFSAPEISPSQMAAFGELLRTSTDFPGAQSAARKWMERQLEKLQEEEKRKGKRRSWLLAPAAGGSTESRGRELLAWIEDERYLGDPPTEDLNRLEALRRFWERLHGLYRYENETGEEMPLPALDLQDKGGAPR
jgi:hypothetical protein